MVQHYRPGVLGGAKRTRRAPLLLLLPEEHSARIPVWGECERGTDRVDFLAYYDGYDTDGDGVFQEYHHDYAPTAGQSAPTIKNHVGTANGGSWQVTWNTQYVPDQGGINCWHDPQRQRCLVRLPEATGLTLQRSGSYVRLYKPLDTPDGPGHGVILALERSCIHVNIPGGDNVGNATSVLALCAHGTASMARASRATTITGNSTVGLTASTVGIMSTPSTSGPSRSHNCARAPMQFTFTLRIFFTTASKSSGPVRDLLSAMVAGRQTWGPPSLPIPRISRWLLVERRPSMSGRPVHPRFPINGRRTVRISEARPERATQRRRLW